MEYVNEIIDYGKLNELKTLDLNDDSFLNELIDLYISQLIDLKNEIHSSFKLGEFLKTSKASHSLKGASLNLGATALAVICKKIETNIKENKTGSIEKLIVQLDNISNITKDVLDEIRKNGIEK